MSSYEALDLASSKDIENTSQETYLRNMGNQLISQIRKSYQNSDLINISLNINNYETYEKNVLFYYLNTRYFGYMSDDLAYYIINSLSSLRNSFPNVFEILVDPAIILKKYLFESFLNYCRNMSTTRQVNNWENSSKILYQNDFNFNKFNNLDNLFSQNNIWHVRSKFKQTLRQKEFHRALGLDNKSVFPNTLIPAAIRNNKNIQFPNIDLLEFFKKNSQFKNNNFLKSFDYINKIDNIFGKEPGTNLINIKRKEALEELFDEQTNKDFCEMLMAYFDAAENIIKNSQEKLFIHNYIIPLSMLTSFRICPSSLTGSLLFNLSGMLPSDENRKFDHLLFVANRTGKEAWVKKKLTEYDISNKFYNSVQRSKIMKELRKLDPLQSISQYKQICMSVASNADQSGDTFSNFKLYTLRLTELDYFSAAQTRKINFETQLDDRIKESLEDFVIGPITRNMIISSKYIQLSKENREDKYDLYTKVIRRKNSEFLKSYKNLEEAGVFKRTSLEMEYEKSGKRRFTIEDLRDFEELLKK